MKQRQTHRVPLSQQALAILREAQAISGDGRFVFPKLGSAFKPMCENAINGALRRLKYSSEQMTAHGFPIDCFHLAKRKREMESRCDRAGTFACGGQSDPRRLPSRSVLAGADQNGAVVERSPRYASRLGRRSSISQLRKLQADFRAKPGQQFDNLLVSAYDPLRTLGRCLNSAHVGHPPA